MKECEIIKELRKWDNLSFLISMMIFFIGCMLITINLELSLVMLTGSVLIMLVNTQINIHKMVRIINKKD